LNSVTLKKMFISPAHKRTEGRAPVWGSEFTSKDAAQQGFGEIAARLNSKLCVLRGGGGGGGGGDWWHLTPFLAQSPSHGNQKPTRKLKADGFGVE
jgi:hypothetical protein